MLEQQEYQNEDFYGQIFALDEITKKVFINCDFTTADFSDVFLVYGCRFENCKLSAAKMNGVKFRNCAFLNCTFNGTGFFATVMEDCKMTGSVFKNVDFSALSIEGGDWSLCELRFAEFRKKKAEQHPLYRGRFNRGQIYKLQNRGLHIFRGCFKQYQLLPVRPSNLQLCHDRYIGH